MRLWKADKEVRLAAILRWDEDFLRGRINRKDKIVGRKFADNRYIVKDMDWAGYRKTLREYKHYGSDRRITALGRIFWGIEVEEVE